VLGGHLDSWHVGQGAHDDGGGIAAAWPAITLICSQSQLLDSNRHSSHGIPIEGGTRVSLPLTRGVWSSWLLAVNGMIGAGIFGLPSEAAKLTGDYSALFPEAISRHCRGLLHAVG
jgi:hypothetical protein